MEKCNASSPARADDVPHSSAAITNDGADENCGNLCSGRAHGKLLIQFLILARLEVAGCVTRD